MSTAAMGQQRGRASAEAVERRRMARRARKLSKDAKEQGRAKHAASSVLTAKVRERIDQTVRQIVQIEKRIDIDALDYRFWECIRCRFNPRRVVRVLMPQPDGTRRYVQATVFDWWKTLRRKDRVELVTLSRLCGRAPVKLDDHRINLWSKFREN